MHVKQGDVIWQFCEQRHPDARGDLAAAFLSSSLSRCGCRAAHSASWPRRTSSFYPIISSFVFAYCVQVSRNIVARLGPGAFETISGAVVNVAMVILTNRHAKADHMLSGFDLVSQASPTAKANCLVSAAMQPTLQSQQVANPNSRIEFGQSEQANTLLAEFGECYQGLVTGDQPRFIRNFWEISVVGDVWSYLKSSCDKGDLYDGQSHVVLWEGGSGQLAKYAKENRDRLHDMHESGNKHWGMI